MRGPEQQAGEHPRLHVQRPVPPDPGRSEQHGGGPHEHAAHQRQAGLKLYHKHQRDIKETRYLKRWRKIFSAFSRTTEKPDDMTLYSCQTVVIILCIFQIYFLFFWIELAGYVSR